MTNSENSSKKKRKGSSKETKLYENLLRVAKQYVLGKSYSPSTESELMQKLGLPEQHIPILQKILEVLSQEGTLEMQNGRYLAIERQNNLVTGILKLHPRGFGFLQPNEGHYTQEVFIPKHLTQNAVDGDVVEVLVNSVVSEKGPEGKVMSILSRSRTHLAGIIRSVEPSGTLIAYSPLLGASQRIVVASQPDFPLKAGDRIVMEVTEWGSKETETLARAARYIGHISDPSCDIKGAIEEFELRSDFSQHTIEEALKLGKQVAVKEIKNREDLREIPCVTIDPDTAKDFDDAVSLTKDKNGHYHLGVHIADVSHYVKPGTALDKEAFDRCNSTYFPGVCVPMLPPELSNNLCSLKPNVNRLTASVFIEFDEKGNQLNYRISRSVIKSAKRFTYKEAKLVLDGKKQSQHAPLLHLMVELCRLLKQKRYERGSIEFSLPELVVLVDDKGVPHKTDYIEYDVTHQMIEEFMLKANEVVATHLSELGKHLTYRVHDQPAEENMRDFAMLANAFGFELSDKPTDQELQEFFHEALQTDYGQYLATSFIRRMRLAVYSADNIGHYGLGLTHYCHFTSPIRRYVDLVVHRILFDRDETKEDLEVVATKCSEQERISAKAEMSVVLLKKLRLLKSYYEQNPQREYEAVVTRVKNFGVTFEILDLMLESFLHVSELDDDYYIFDEAKSTLQGKRHGHSFRAGDRLHVIVKDIDLILGDTAWYFVSKEDNENEIHTFPPASSKKKKRDKRFGDKRSNKAPKRPSKKRRSKKR